MFAVPAQKGAFPAGPGSSPGGGSSYSELMDPAPSPTTIDLATQRLLDTARLIAEPELRAPAAAGLDPGHVLAHLARNQRDAELLAARGRQPSAYASAEARQADIERGAGLRPDELMAELADSAMALRTVPGSCPLRDGGSRCRSWTRPLSGRLSCYPAAGRGGADHCDLGAGYGPADWPATFATMELAEPMRSQRQDRLSYPDPSEAAKLCHRPGRPRRGILTGRSRGAGLEKVDAIVLPRTGSASGSRYRWRAGSSLRMARAAG